MAQLQQAKKQIAGVECASTERMHAVTRASGQMLPLCPVAALSLWRRYEMSYAHTLQGFAFGFVLLGVIAFLRSPVGEEAADRLKQKAAELSGEQKYSRVYE